MKKIILIFLFFGAFLSNSQTIVFSENFGTGNDINGITQFTNTGTGWLVDDGTTYAVCNVAASSANSMLVAEDADAVAGNSEHVGTTVINALNFSSLSITWNTLRSSTSGPAITFSFATSASGPWTQVNYTNSSNGNWVNVGSVSLPSQAISSTLFLRWEYVSTGSSGLEFALIDDIVVTGVGTPVFYWDGTGGLDDLSTWWDSPTFVGLNPSDFTTPGQTFNIWQPTATLTAAWNVSGLGTSVYVGDGTASNQCELVIPSGFALTLSSSAKIFVTDNSTLTIQNTTFPAIGSVSISPLSTVKFGQASAVTLWSTTYGNLYLLGGGNKLEGTLLTVGGEFNVASGTSYLMSSGASRNTRLRGTVNVAGSITTAFSNLIFEGSGTIGSVNFSGSTAINNLIMNRSGQNLTLAGSGLNVAGIVTASVGTIASGGLLTLKANTNLNLNGRIGPITGNITGNIKVETRAPGGNTDWAVLGPSGVSGLTVASWEGQIPMSCYSCPNDENSTSGHFVSIQGWDETAAASSTAAYIEMSYTDPLSVGTGYWTYLGNGPTSTSDITWTVTGPIVKNNQSINLSNSTAANGDGYNLISNPYPCPISWSALRNGNASVDNAYYVYCAQTGNTSSFVNGVSNPAAGQTGSLTNTIPMGQGFYVRATSNTNLTAQETNKVTTGVPFLNRPAANSGFLRLKIAGGGYSDETVVNYDNIATSNFDSEYDAYKIYSSAGYVNANGPWTKRTVIATQLNNVDYSINSLPASASNSVIPVVARVYSTGSYTISAFDLQNISVSTCVTLKDKLLNVTHDLKMSDYVCNISDTTYASRFELTVCNNAVTSINPNSVSVSNSIAINKDELGIFVDFDFAKATNANIIVANVLGQRIMDAKKVKVTNDNIYLDLNVNDQLIFVTVETENEKVTKKFLNFR